VSSAFVYVYGTNGSGKTTLAREVIKAAGGVAVNRPGVGKASVTHTVHGAALVGRYGNACGGIDGIQPYADAVDVIFKHGALEDTPLFAEGLVQPGWRNCELMASWFDTAQFILLETPEDQCVANVLKRRAAAGNTKPYDPANLHRKASAARSWANLLERNGVPVVRLNYPQAKRLTFKLLGL
jgi:hypothetical protein